MPPVNPIWVSIVVGVISSLITAAVFGAIGFAALKAWMARREERETSIRSDVDDHEIRLRQIERGPHLDYARR